MDLLVEPGWEPAVRLPLADAARLAGVDPKVLARLVHDGQLGRGEDKRLTIDVAELRLIYPHLPFVPGEPRPRPDAMLRPEVPRRRRPAPPPRQKIGGWLALGMVLAVLVATGPFLRRYLDPDVESFNNIQAYRVQLDPKVRAAVVRRGPGPAWDAVAVLPPGTAVAAWGRSRDDDRWLAVRTRRGEEGYLPEAQLRRIATRR